jgi:hypothetical protein
MNITINEEILKENKISISDFFLILASYHSGSDIREHITSLIEKDYLSKSALIIRTDLVEIIRQALTQTEQNIKDVNTLSNDLKFIEALQDLFPPNGSPMSRTNRKPIYYQCNSLEVQQRLKRFALKTGLMDKCKIYEATRLYTSHFKNKDYTYMSKITSFILRHEHVENEVDYDSGLLTHYRMIEKLINSNDNYATLFNKMVQSFEEKNKVLFEFPKTKEEEISMFYESCVA